MMSGCWNLNSIGHRCQIVRGFASGSTICFHTGILVNSGPNGPSTESITFNCGRSGLSPNWNSPSSAIVQYPLAVVLSIRTRFGFSWYKILSLFDRTKSINNREERLAPAQIRVFFQYSISTSSLGRNLVSKNIIYRNL